MSGSDLAKPKMNYAAALKSGLSTTTGRPPLYTGTTPTPDGDQYSDDVPSQDIPEPGSSQLSNMSTSAKPYVPSYLAAIRKNMDTVHLEGFPVNIRKVNNTISTTTSTMFDDPDTNSSWADDDESFLRTIAIAEAQRGMVVATEPSTANSTGRRNTSGFRGGGGRSTHNGNKNERGWRTIERDAPSHRGRGRKRNTSRPDVTLSGGRFDAFANAQIKRHL